MKNLKMVMIICVFAALASGCASLSPQLYTLNPTAKPGGDMSSITVTVGPVSVPAAVDRPQLVLSIPPNQLRFDEFNRWATPLKSDIARVVAENLSLILGSPYISVFPQSLSISPSYRVTLDVTRFESVPGGAAKLTAIWWARSTADGRVQEGATTLTEPLKDNGYSALIDAHSRMIGKLSGDIAAALRTLAVTGRKEPGAAGK